MVPVNDNNPVDGSPANGSNATSIAVLVVSIFRFRYARNFERSLGAIFENVLFGIIFESLGVGKFSVGFCNPCSLNTTIDGLKSSLLQLQVPCLPFIHGRPPLFRQLGGSNVCSKSRCHNVVFYGCVSLPATIT
jgi:hypothetical protein